MLVVKRAFTIFPVENESLGQRKHKFTCYIKLLRKIRVLHSKASFSLTLGNLIWNCPV